MKRTSYTLFMSLLIAGSLASCSSDDDFSPAWQSDPMALKIQATVGSGVFTRSNPLADTAEEQAKFNSNDKISIQAGTQGAVTYTYNGTDTWTPETDKYLKWETNEMAITAYYPVVAGVSATAFTLPADQSDVAKITAADYMVNITPAATKPTDSDVLTLTMNRQMARVIIKIVGFNSQYGTGDNLVVPTVTDVNICSAFAAYTASAPAGDPTAVAPYVSNLDANNKVQVGTTYTALVIPASDAKTEATFVSMKVNDVDLVVKGIPALSAGYSYTYNLTIGKDELSVDNDHVTVAPWGDATVIPGGEAVQSRPLAVGDYYYSDGTYSTAIDATKTVIGIVFYQGDVAKDDAQLRAKIGDTSTGSHGLVVALNDIPTSDGTIAWGCYGTAIGKGVSSTNTNDYVSIAVTTGVSGTCNQLLGYNNSLILRAWNTNVSNSNNKCTAMEQIDTNIGSDKTFPVAPSTSSGWYFPSIKELSLLCSGNFIITGYAVPSGAGTVVKAKVNNAIAALNNNPACSQIANAGYYSSSEDWSNSPTFRALEVTMNNGQVNYYSKEGVNDHVRPVLAF